MTDIAVKVNGKSEQLKDAKLTALLSRHDIQADTRGIAIAINGAIVPREQWIEKILNTDDRIEIVHARQGG